MNMDVKERLIAAHIQNMSTFHSDFMKLISMMGAESDSNDFGKYLPEEGSESDEDDQDLMSNRPEKESEAEHISDPYEGNEDEIHVRGQLGYSNDAPESFPASYSYTESDINLDGMSYGVYLGLPRGLSVHDTIAPTGLHPIIGGMFR